MSGEFNIAGRRIGPGAEVYVIAELSGNHRQSFDEAVRLVRAAKDAGADAVKLQTYTADTLTICCEAEYFKIKGTPWAGQSLYELYRQAYTPWEWQPKLKMLADELGITLFSTPFDESAVEFLEKMNVPAHKVASFELVDLALIGRIARTGKPVIMSTGMATKEEIGEAVLAVRLAGGTQLALLKCTSAYPAKPEEMNLHTIPDMAVTFGVPVGLSDHTLDIAVPVAAVALGACIIEKHLTLSRQVPGPDSAFSLEPHEFKAMVGAVRSAERAMGTVNYGLRNDEKESRVFRRSLFVVEDVRAGEPFTPKNVRSIRPGSGLPPKHLPVVLGQQARTDIRRGTPLSWDLVAKP
jgi:pseudaminic acid synthase